MKTSLRYPLSALALCALFLVTMPTAQAGAWSWAKRLPVNQYTPQDIEVMKSVLNEVLDSGADGVEAEWSNPETGHGGSITPLNSIDQDGRQCRQTRIRNLAKSTENISEYFLCKQPDGVWAAEEQLAQ